MSKVAIRVEGLSKSYRLYNEPIDRLKEALNPFKKVYYHDFYALNNVSFEVKTGEVLGIIGNNGAGKSTLLKILSGVLTPTSGTVNVEGKIASLLELGAGFNPEYTGTENIYLQGTLMGFSRTEMAERVDGIIAFADIGEFIHQSVKMYSSGMFARLAFAVATSVDPDILIIDEALSVGDGTFARKSFDRIMQLKDRGCTILFCSHSLYQVEVLCQKVMWVEKGEIKTLGEPSGVVNMYQKYLDFDETDASAGETADAEEKSVLNTHARIKKVRVFCDDGQEGNLKLISEVSTLGIDVTFVSDISLPTPSVAVIITDDAKRNITSCSTFYDGVAIELDVNGEGKINLTFDKIGLRKGRYYLYVFLMCENAIYTYESAQCASLDFTQKGFEIGPVALPRIWK